MNKISTEIIVSTPSIQLWICPLIKAIHVAGLGSLKGYEMLRIPHCLGNRQQMSARMSALRTGRSLLPRNIIFLLLLLISLRG
jgi:hypothetical protein